jgi:type I restriction enzyme M protein
LSNCPNLDGTSDQEFGFGSGRFHGNRQHRFSLEAFMLGAVAGDIIGSRFEWNNHRSKEFTLFSGECFPTDDSIMTLALADALLDWRAGKGELSALAVEKMRKVGQRYPNCGYGGRFGQWMFSADPKPYISFGNGAAMRVSACGHVATSLEEVKEIARAVTAVTHDHPEGLKGAEATAVCIFGALHRWSINDIRDYVESHYYPLNRTLDEIRPEYQFNEICQETVPESITAFLESTGFEDAIRNAISIGGDSDTVAAIAGGIARAYYGVPDSIAIQARTYLDSRLTAVLDRFEAEYPLRVGPSQG